MLGGLVALAWWGHAHHWKLPKFSRLTGGNSTPLSTTADNEGMAYRTLRVVRPEAGAPHAMPLLEFSTPEALHAVGIETVPAAMRPLDEYIDAHGVVAYNENRLAQLSTRVPGTVFRVEKQVGQSVKKGDVLAILDAVEVGRAKATFLQDVVAAEHKAKNLERLLSVTGVVAEKQIREAQAELRESRIRRFNAQQTLINLGLPVEYTEKNRSSDEELEERIQFIGLPQEIVETLDRKTTTANLIPLRSPFDGAVITREVVVGEVVDSTQVQFVIADVTKMWIKLDVRKEDAQRLDIGQEVVFTSDSFTGEVRSQLKWISTEVGEKTRTVQARADAENPLLESAGSDASEGQRLLRANIFGMGHIHVRHQDAALMVPKAAIQWMDVTPIVFVVQEQARTIEPRKVSVGASEGAYTEVRSGIQAGETVVSHGSHLIKSELARDVSSAP